MTKHILNDLPQQKVSGSTMTYPLIRTGRSLAGMVLVLLGLSTYGCGDTGTQSDPAELGNLSVSNGTLEPRFNPATTSYVVQLSTDVSSTTITASPRVTGDTIRIDNQQTSSQTVTLDSPGEEQSINIVVTETGTGGTSRSYTVRVRRDLEDNSLRALSVSSGTLTPTPFNKDTLDYTVNNISTSVTSITISATKSDRNSIMQIGSVTVPAGTESGDTIVQLGGTGSTTPVSIDIMRPSGSKRTYKVTINRGPSDNAFLRSLSISLGTSNQNLIVGFNPDTTSYTVNLSATLASNVTNVRVTPTLQDATASMTVNGQATNSGQAQTAPLPSPDSNTIINIVVTAQDRRTQRIYTVNVVRAALGEINNLQSLTVTNQSLDPPFNASTLGYTVNVASTVASVTVRPTLPPNSNASMSLRVNSGQLSNINSGETRTITLGQPDSNTFINIIITAQNGSRNTYVIAVDRAASNDNNLSALSVRVGNASQALSPSFARNTTAYTVDVASNVTSVTVSATKSDRNATMAIGSVTVPAGTELGQAPVGLGGQGSETPVAITVTPQIGNPKTYVITITRLSSNTNLSTLSVTAGTTVLPVSPPFGSNTVNVATDVISVRVTATLEDTNATLEINGQGISSGVASSPITLGEQGSNTNIPLVVIAPSGTRKDYTITVHRAAPAAPAAPTVEPDLISEDDSCLLIGDLCFPPTSNVDNITNVKRPRFRIPQLAAGETPSLYIDTNKDVSASFDAVTNTLRPSADLSDGNHSITYTLTNIGGESNPSPSLTVTVDTGAPVQ